MKFIGAYQSVAELSEKVALLEQEEKKNPDQLLVVTKEEHEEDLKHVLDIRIKTISKEAADKEKPLGEFGLDDETIKMYDETIRLGGYVLLEEIDENTHSTGTRDATEDPISKEGTGNIPAPGFGVVQDDPSHS